MLTGGPVDGDILAETNKPGQVEHDNKPAFSVWRTWITFSTFNSIFPDVVVKF